MTRPKKIKKKTSGAQTSWFPKMIHQQSVFIYIMLPACQPGITTPSQDQALYKSAPSLPKTIPGHRAWRFAVDHNGTQGNRRKKPSMLTHFPFPRVSRASIQAKQQAAARPSPNHHGGDDDDPLPDAPRMGSIGAPLDLLNPAYGESSSTADGSTTPAPVDRGTQGRGGGCGCAH